MEAIVEGSPLGSLETLGQLGEGGVDEKGLRKVRCVIHCRPCASRIFDRLPRRNELLVTECGGQN